MLPPRPTDGTLRVLAWACAAVALVAATGAALLNGYARSQAAVDPIVWADLVVGGLWPLAGAVLLHARPRNACGWVLTAAGAVAVYELMAQYSLVGTRVAESRLPLQGLTDWVAMWGFTPYFVVVPLTALLFPDGRFLGPAWRRLGRAVVALAIAATVSRMLVPSVADVDPAIENPLGVERLYVLNYVVLVTAYGIFLVVMPLAVWGLVRRTRQAVGVERAELQWFLLGGLLLVVGIVGSIVRRDGTLSDALFTAGLAAVPASIVVAVARRWLLDVDLALRRALALVLVVAVVAVAWFALVLALGPRTAASPTELALVALSAVAAVSLRGVVQGWVDRRLFPHRRAVGELVARVNASVADAAEPREALERLVEATRAVLHLPYAAFRGPVEAVAGTPGDRVERLDAASFGRVVGTLEVGRRRQGEGFGAGERQLLDHVAGQAATLAYAASLVVDVEQSRERIVMAREEERRRLRNDLHDGVGPALAGLALQLDALGARVRRRDPADAAAVHEVRDRVREVVRDVRAVSHGLRPPILDQVGLADALRELVADLGVVRGTAEIGDVTGLPAASEVAAYAIAAESVANVARHSAASSVDLRVERSTGSLVLTVRDNGRGMPVRPRAGVGLTSMRERATEVGGSLEHLAAPGGGTIVRVELPLDVAAPADATTVAPLEEAR